MAAASLAISVVAILVAGWSAWSQHRFNREQTGAADLYFWISAHYGSSAEPDMRLSVENRGTYDAEFVSVSFNDRALPPCPRLKVGEVSALRDWQPKAEESGPYFVVGTYSDKLGSHPIHKQVMITEDNLE